MTTSQCPESEIRWHSVGAASRLAALLIAQIFPIFALFAPCHPGASPPSVLNAFLTRDTRAVLTSVYRIVVSKCHRENGSRLPARCGHRDVHGTPRTTRSAPRPDL